MVIHDKKYIIIIIAVAFSCFSPAYAQISVLWEVAVETRRTSNLAGIAQLGTGNFALLADTTGAGGEFYRLSESGQVQESLEIPIRPYKLTHVKRREFLVAGYLYPNNQNVIASYSIPGWEYHQLSMSTQTRDIMPWGNDYMLCLYQPGQIRRVDSTGNTLWNTLLDDNLGLWTLDATITEFGELTIPNTTSDSFVLTRILADGVVTQADTINQYGGSLVNSIEVSPSGFTYISGNLELAPESHALAIFSPTNVLLDTWGSASTYATFVLLPDGGLITAGSIYPEVFLHIQRYDASRNMLWDIEYEYDGHNSVFPMSDTQLLFADNGDLVMAGTHFYYGGGDNWDLPRPYIARFALDPTVQEIRANALPAWVDTTVVQPGGGFVWRGELRNHADAPHTTDVWVIARGPNGFPSQPFRVWEDVEIPADGVFQAYFSQFIPEDTPPGRYNYIVRMGDASTLTPRFQAHFPFRVIGDVPPLRPRGGVPGAGLEPVVPQLPPPTRTTAPARITERPAGTE